MRGMRAAGMTSVISVVVASLVGFTTPAPTEQPESYIVELAEGASVEEVIADAPVDVEPTETYEALGEGFAAELTSDEVAELEALPEVVAVYEDLPMTVGATQSSAPWNLSRLDQASAPADSTYTYPDSAGAGARVYVVDTGVSPNAGQLGARLLPGMTAINDGNGTADCQGHGTHVAGTVASTTWGVAKQASIVPIRVFACSGPTYTSTVISGLDWIVANHPAGTPGIVNMSLGSTDPIARTTPDALTNKVNQLADLGFIVVVAAGNSGADACDYSPSRATKAITVAATTTTDARAGFSNYGSCVDIFAPGTGIRSLKWDDPAGSMLMQGTSMAAPHAAGASALIAAASSGMSATQVIQRLLADSLLGVVSGSSGSPNRLLAARPSEPAADEIAAVYRFWSNTYQSHFYTRSVAERDFVYLNYPRSVWQYEGPAFGAYGTALPGTTPVYRFWSTEYSAHFYTASVDERDFVIANYPSRVWQYEGVAYYAYPLESTEPGTAVISRFWSPTYRNHFFTASSDEASFVRANYPSQIWTFEGTPFRVPMAFTAPPALP